MSRTIAAAAFPLMKSKYWLLRLKTSCTKLTKLDDFYCDPDWIPKRVKVIVLFIYCNGVFLV